MNGNVGVGRSTNGGKTFSAPINVSPPDEFFGDKDAMTVGPDPVDEVARQHLCCVGQLRMRRHRVFRGSRSGAVHRPRCDLDDLLRRQALRHLRRTESELLVPAIHRRPAVGRSQGRHALPGRRAISKSTTRPARVGRSPRTSRCSSRRTAARISGAASRSADVAPRHRSAPSSSGRACSCGRPSSGHGDLQGALYVAWNDGSNASSDHSHIRLAKSTNKGAN